MSQISVLILYFGVALCAAQSDPLNHYVCETSEHGYLVPDPYQCDRYAICRADGTKQIHLCQDGYALDSDKGTCDLINKVDCSDRNRLQITAVSDDSPCKRANGYFPVLEGEKRCFRFFDCRNGVHYLHDCPAGTVFNTESSECLHPDQATRAECSASTLFEFECPNFKDVNGKRGIRLRFGDHDRVPHPTDCSKFYACLTNGQPRLSSCTAPLVFNPTTGFCTHYSQVESCKDFYSAESLDKANIFVITKIKQ